MEPHTTSHNTTCGFVSIIIEDRIKLITLGSAGFKESVNMAHQRHRFVMVNKASCQEVVQNKTLSVVKSHQKRVRVGKLRFHYAWSG